MPAAALRQAGLDVAALQPDALALTHEGRPVAFQVVGRGKSQEVRFYGEAPGRDAYTGEAVYWLTQTGSGAEASGGMAARGAAPSDVAAATVITATVSTEEQEQYDGMAAAGDDRWLWQTIFAPTEIQVPIQAPHAAAGEAVLRVRLVANSSAPVDPDHHLILSLNDAQVADERWDGIGAHVITATVPSGTVRSGENTLTIKAPGDTGAPADSVVLDWVELTYPRELALDQGELAFGGQAAAYNLTTSGELAALWDITDPDRARGVERLRSSGRPGALRIRRHAAALHRGHGCGAAPAGYRDTGGGGRSPRLARRGRSDHRDCAAVP